VTAVTSVDDDVFVVRLDSQQKSTTPERSHYSVTSQFLDLIGLYALVL